MQTDAATVTSGDITIDSNHENADQIALAFSEEAPAAAEPTGEPPPPDAPVEAEVAPEAVDDAPEETEAATPVASKARRRSATAAVQSAVTKQREAERRADMAEARLDALTPATPSAPAAAITPEWSRLKALPGAPKADQFENYDDYTAALATFVTDTRQREYDTRRQTYLQEQTQKEAHAVKATQWQERLTKARADNPDLDATLDPDVPMSLPMQYLAMESPVGIELLQYLSAHPDESQRMSTLHPAEVYRSMGKLEERLSAASTPSGPARAISHAKPPITPLGSSPHTPDVTEISDDLSFDEHFKRMNAADRKRGLL
jgi:hypothetical protein